MVRLRHRQGGSADGQPDPRRLPAGHALSHRRRRGCRDRLLHVGARRDGADADGRSRRDHRPRGAEPRTRGDHAGRRVAHGRRARPADDRRDAGLPPRLRRRRRRRLRARGRGRREGPAPGGGQVLRGPRRRDRGPLRPPLEPGHPRRGRVRGRDGAPRQGDDGGHLMSETAVKTIAVGTDGSGTATKAVEFALDMAERYSASVVFISSYRPVNESRLRKEQDDAPQDIQWSINPAEDVEATLRDVEELAQERGLKWTSEAKEGDPADVLVELAEKHDADVLVIGNKGMQRRVLGSVPNSVTHKARCSVMVVKTT